MNYIYLGDRFTASELKNKPCTAVKKPNSKCIRGKNSNMLVEINGIKTVILGRRLRKI
jgi:hypothetical protein